MVGVNMTRMDREDVVLRNALLKKAIHSSNKNVCVHLIYMPECMVYQESPAK